MNEEESIGRIIDEINYELKNLEIIIVFLFQIMALQIILKNL